MMRPLWIFAPLLLFPISADAVPLFMNIGELREIHLKESVERFAIGNSKKLSVHQSEQSETTLLLKGKAIGRSDLWIQFASGRTQTFEVHLIPLEKKAFPSHLTSLLLRAHAMKVRIQGDQIFLEGKVASAKDALLAKTIHFHYPKQVWLDLSVDEVVRTELEEAINQKTPSRCKAFIDSRLQGSVQCEQGTDAFNAMGQLERWHVFFPPSEGSPNAPSEVVYFRAFLLQLSSGSSHHFGLHWGSSLESFRLISIADLKTFLSTHLSVDARSDNGRSRVLAQPELIVRVPGKAEVFSGGEVPYERKRSRRWSLEWKSWGVRLLINALSVSRRSVRIDVEAEISEPDERIASSDRFPGFRSNQIKTQLDAQFGHPILLSGLLQTSQKEFESGLPWLKNIPLLGFLFGTQNARKANTQLAAILIPYSFLPPHAIKRVFPNAPSGPLPIPRNRYSDLEAQELQKAKDFPWNAFPCLPGS